MRQVGIVLADDDAQGRCAPACGSDGGVNQLVHGIWRRERSGVALGAPMMIGPERHVV